MKRRPIRCPYCHDDIRIAEPTKPCGHCQAAAHAACWAELGRCAVCGRSGRAPPAWSGRDEIDWRSPRVQHLVAAAVLLGMCLIGVFQASLRPGPRLVREPSKNLVKPTPAARRGAASSSGEDQTQLTDHLHEGQKFVFEQTMDQPTMGMKTNEVYEVKEFTSTHLIYDVVRTTKVWMKNPPPGMPPMKPNVQKQLGQRHPLTGPEGSRRRSRDGPKPVGEETIFFGGIRFDCKIYENSGTRTWIDPRRWPLLIKMEGKIKRRLVRIEDR